MNNNNSYPFPVLGNGRLDYGIENSYSFEQQSETSSNKMVFKHILKGKNLITQLIKNKEAKFFATMCLKSAIHRETYQTTLDINKDDDFIEVKQLIPFRQSNKEQSFCGFIVYTGKDKNISLNQDSGVNKFWLGEDMVLKKGMILARSNWVKIERNIGEIITARIDENIKHGFKVDVSSENGGCFEVAIEPNLYKELSNLQNAKSQIKNNFINNILCSAFYELKSKFDDFKECENFQLIFEKLREKELPGFDDDDFSPSVSATAFIDIKLEMGENNDD